MKQKLEFNRPSGRAAREPPR